MHSAVLHARSIRQRLFNPPNAVRDTGFHARRKSLGVRGCDARLVFVPAPIEEPKPVAKSERDEINCVPQNDEKVERAETSLKDILLAVCEVYDAYPLDIKSDRRAAEILLPRHITMVLAKYLTASSTAAIGRFLGKDHTTVMHALRKMKPVEDALHASMPPDAPLFALALKAAELERDMHEALKVRGRELRKR